MPKQFKTARQINKLKVIEAAKKLGISQPTLSAWEGERKSPSIDSLENMADLYGVTTDFLLGRSETPILDSKQPISQQVLPAFHGRPVWSASYGWLLVNAADRLLTFPDGHTLPFSDIIGDLFIFSLPFSESDPPKELPLSRSEVSRQKEIWLEPISPDSDLRKELRGTASKIALSRMSIATVFIWILTIPSGWHSLLKSSHRKDSDTQYSYWVSEFFNYSCFLNRLPNYSVL